MNRRLAIVLLLCLPAASQVKAPPSFPPDMIAHDSPIRDVARLDPKHVRIDTENLRIRVLRITLAAGEMLPLHDSRDGLLVCLTACSLALTNPVGYVREVKLEAGQNQWIPAERHKLATTAGPVELLYIEAKRPQN